MNFKKDIKRQMKKGWLSTYRDTLLPITYKRNLEATSSNPNNDITSPRPHYDPVTETWIYPTGVADNVSYSLTGLYREAVKDAGKDPDLLTTDYKITVLYDTLKDLLTTNPYTSDTVELEGKEYRVVKWNADSIQCFYNLFVRGV